MECKFGVMPNHLMLTKYRCFSLYPTVISHRFLGAYLTIYYRNILKHKLVCNKPKAIMYTKFNTKLQYNYNHLITYLSSLTLIGNPTSPLKRHYCLDFISLKLK